MGRVLIACYHGVSSVWPNPTAISERVLEHQVRLMRRLRYVGFTLGELVERMRAGTLPARAVAVTFDDGYASVLRAQPILAAAGYPATVFVVTSFVESGQPLVWPGVEQWSDGPYADELRPLSWAEIDDLLAAGWEIGSHTNTHPFLPATPDDALERELVLSRDAVARRAGRCDVLAYPYGAVDDRVVGAVRAAGYRAACVVGLAAPGEDDLRLGRVGLYGRDASLRLRTKLSPVARAVVQRVARPRGRAA